MTDDMLEVEIWRGGAEGAFRRYAVPRQENQTVLDVVTHIQRRIDPSLAYRFACRVGMCGSCAMTVNGIPRWTCRTHVSRVVAAGASVTLRVAPLANLPVIRDLVTDMAPFFDKWAKAEGRFVADQAGVADFALVPPASARRKEAEAGIECIGCGVCYAACDVVRWNPDYLGPAALNRAWTLANDVRDQGGARRLEAVAGDAGCHACHSHENCSTYCPKGLDPTRSIAGLKRRTAFSLLNGGL
ncbi:MAG: succinate dehydrogenase/fumarate reductase iron-sulfur subunit [Proteobacteria bacterium]|nr:succinate dehydrogenase/fumarate reductase iron-sulfur subunit [Pseudomonadota bacterium]